MKFGIHLSPEAIKAAKFFQESTPEYKNKSLRLYFAGKGCDGFKYGVSFDDKDTQDIVFDWGSIQVIVDPQTLPYVEGSVIDWVDDERGKGFLVDNPGHRKFRGKFYKKDNWQERLLTKGQPNSETSTPHSTS